MIYGGKNQPPRFISAECRVPNAEFDCDLISRSALGALIKKDRTKISGLKVYDENLIFS
jgi:hypothetical protein